MTKQIVVLLTLEEARALSNAIRLDCQISRQATDALEDVGPRVVERIERFVSRNGWRSLDYPSCSAWLTGEAIDVGGLSPEFRVPVVSLLRSEGASTRAIARAVRTSAMQVSRDDRKSAGVTPVTPDLDRSQNDDLLGDDDREDDNSGAGSWVPPKPIRRTIGLDGKSYPRTRAVPIEKPLPVEDTTTKRRDMEYPIRKVSAAPQVGVEQVIRRKFLIEIAYQADGWGTWAQNISGIEDKITDDDIEAALINLKTLRECANRTRTYLLENRAKR